MAVALEFIDLIIKISSIEERYCGGFSQYKRDHENLIGGRIWYDDYIVRDGAMNSQDIQSTVRRLEWKGLIPFSGEGTEAQKWEDMCVVEGKFGGKTLTCDWLELSEDNQTARFVDDHSELLADYDNPYPFDPATWLKKLKEGSNDQELRTDIFRQTTMMVNRGGYSLNDEWLKLPKQYPSLDTLFYYYPKPLSPIHSEYKTKFSVIEADCLETALLLQNSGFNVCVVNMADRYRPGGGVRQGVGAQEEDLFRRSSLFKSLYQLVYFGYKYRVEGNPEHSYPLSPTNEGIYSKDMTVFRGAENSGYCLLQKPCQVSFITVPAIIASDLKKTGDVSEIEKSLIELAKEKIRTILRIAGANGRDCLVLGTFGWDAFRNASKRLANVFKECFEEPEFTDRFKSVVFVINDDYNYRKTDNAEENLLSFFKLFC